MGEMSGATAIKICGITSVSDALMAVEAGAWAVGCIMWDGSARRCEQAQAREICKQLHREAQVCGVFVNAPLDQVVGEVDALGFTMVQLHGDEGPAFCEAVRSRTGAKVIKAIRVHSGEQVNDLERFHHVDYHLLDTYHEDLRGGTGESWDWSLAASRHSSIPLILSGGLDSGNVAEAIAAVHPFAVDTASGTDSSPGVKDPEKVEDFCRAVGLTATSQPTEEFSS
ncbi:MAG: phosphoribosylanthranilate isomerase [Actinobacteria bacterium]|uniref:phosphoribosylanthranilate isomerase n=1 Tax=freshwater metagenome TaxID=449393 RepID=A0A6J5ZP60_9ZZZZ|nr:phosphoribosylanthranilate isomerase [Actinomycetota bacterium]